MEPIDDRAARPARTLTERVERLEALVARLMENAASGLEISAQLPATHQLASAPAEPASQSHEPSLTGPDSPGHDPYFALNALKRALPAPGGVVFAGAVDLPGDRRAEWQYGLTTETLADEDWSARSEAIAALGHPVRLQLVQEVLLGMATVAELSAIEGLGTSGQVYHHLRTLTAAGWLQATTRGRYEVPVARIIPLLVLVLAARR